MEIEIGGDLDLDLDYLLLPGRIPIRRCSHVDRLTKTPKAHDAMPDAHTSESGVVRCGCHHQYPPRLHRHARVDTKPSEAWSAASFGPTTEAVAWQSGDGRRMISRVRVMVSDRNREPLPSQGLVYKFIYYYFFF